MELTSLPANGRLRIALKLLVAAVLIVTLLLLAQSGVDFVYTGF